MPKSKVKTKAAPARKRHHRDDDEFVFTVEYSPDATEEDTARFLLMMLGYPSPEIERIIENMKLISMEEM